MPTAVGASLACMSLISPELRDTLALWCYRTGAFLVFNVLDDPAWLALMFC